MTLLSYFCQMDGEEREKFGFSCCSIREAAAQPGTLRASKEQGLS